MEKYDYFEAVKRDVKNAINELYSVDELNELISEDRDGLESDLNDKLWIDDSVTGNASGSYTFNSWQAEENLCHNWDLLSEALNEFGCGVTDIANGAEYCDVTIRCYLLNSAIRDVLDELEK